MTGIEHFFEMAQYGMLCGVWLWIQSWTIGVMVRFFAGSTRGYDVD